MSTTFFTAANLFARFLTQDAFFAKAKNPVPSPHPNRRGGHWVTTSGGSHVYIGDDGKSYQQGEHPENRAFRSVAVPVPDEVFDRLGIKPLRVTADYITLDRKHQDQFTGPEDVKQHVESVLSSPTHILPGEAADHRLIVRREETDKAVALEIVFKGGAYRVQSAFTLTTGQLEAKLNKAPEGWKAEFSAPAGGSQPSIPMSHGDLPSSFWGATVPFDTDSTGISIISRSDKNWRPLVLFARFAMDSKTPGDAGLGTWQDGDIKHRLTWNGLDISIENPAGSIRQGRDASGTPWRTEMTCDYGYFDAYNGYDGDKPDVLIGPDITSPSVFVVNQKAADGTFDECKVIIGTKDIAQAHALYLSNYQEGWEVNIHSMRVLDIDGFKAWLSEGLGAESPSFFADFATAEFSVSAFVSVPARLSRVGNYADKGIELTESDFDRVAASVSEATPVPMNLAHLRRGSVLDGAGLGEIRKTWRKGDELWGEIAVPQWLASLARERDLKLPLSAEWDIKTKTLRGCAWERTPRIEDAQALL